MPNYVKNKIEFICDKKTMGEIFEKYNSHCPAYINRAHDESIICIKKDSDRSTFGWFYEKTGEFERRDQETIIGLPDGWEFEIKKSCDHFPDFNNVIPQPKNIFRGDLGSKEKQSCIDKGIPNWYDWNCENWGTKWNSMENKKIDDNIFVFETAWSSVKEIIVKISLEFPHVGIIYTYADEDTGSNCGKIVFKKGQINSSIIPECGAVNAYKIAFELNPELKKQYNLIDGNYEYNDE